MKKLLLALLAALGLTASAHAASFLIGGLGFHDGAGFRYSLLHQGTATNAMAGQVLAWLELDPSWTGSSLDAAGVDNDGMAFYRDTDGRIEFRANLYDGFSAPFTLPIGSVVVTGTGFTPARLDAVGHDLKVMGYLAFDFDLVPGDLADWVGAVDAVVDLSYVDKNYGVATQEGTVVNGKTATQIALWGARGDSVYVNAEGGLHWDQEEWTSFHTSPLFPTEGNQLGNDLVVDLGATVTDCLDDNCIPTPEPATLALMASGLVGLAVMRRKQR